MNMYIREVFLCSLASQGCKSIKSKGRMEMLSGREKHLRASMNTVKGLSRRDAKSQ